MLVYLINTNDMSQVAIEQLSIEGIQATTSAHYISGEAFDAEQARINQRWADRVTKTAEKRRVREELRALVPKREIVLGEGEGYAWVPFEASAAMDQLRRLTLDLASGEKAVYGSIVGSRPVFRQLPNWEARLKEKVLSILNMSTPPDLLGGNTQLLEQLYDQNPEIWHAAMTDFTWNPNEGFNYEIAEKLGDSTAATGLIDYLTSAGAAMGRVIGEHEISVAQNSILAKQEQARVSRELGLPQFLRTIYNELTVGQEEDLFESFFGAAYMMGVSQGIGQSLCNNLIYWMADTDLIKIPDRFETPFKTQIVNVFNAHGWGVPRLVNRREGKAYVTEIHLSDAAMRSQGRNISVLDIWDARAKMLGEISGYPSIDNSRFLTIVRSGGLIGTGRASNQALAEVAAYRSSVDVFKQIGLIRAVEYEERIKLNQNYNIALESSFFPALEKAMREGYDNIFAADARQSERHQVGLLYGIKGKTKRVIYMVSMPDARDLRARKDSPLISATALRRILYDEYVADSRSMRQLTEETDDDEVTGVSRPDEDDAESDVDE